MKREEFKTIKVGDILDVQIEENQRVYKVLKVHKSGIGVIRIAALNHNTKFMFVRRDDFYFVFDDNYDDELLNAIWANTTILGWLIKRVFDKKWRIT